MCQLKTPVNSVKKNNKKTTRVYKTFLQLHTVYMNSRPNIRHNIHNIRQNILKQVVIKIDSVL